MDSRVVIEAKNPRDEIAEQRVKIEEVVDNDKDDESIRSEVARAYCRKWISVDSTDLFKLQNLVVQLSTELFDFQPSLI